MNIIELEVHVKNAKEAPFVNILEEEQYVEIVTVVVFVNINRFVKFIPFGINDRM